MTTKQKDEIISRNPPVIYRIEYPNSKRGMFSLRAPFKDVYYKNENPQQIYTTRQNPTVIRPEYLHINRNQTSYQPYAQRDAQVQCSIDSRDDVRITRRQYNTGYLSPRYRVALQLRPRQPNIYEAWDVATPPPRSIPINEPIRTRERSIRARSPRLVTVKSLSDSESDYDDTILYARYPPAPAPCCHPHTGMVCIRHHTNTICY